MVERWCWQRGWRARPVMWNCVNCGNYVDKVIAFNRAMAKPETDAQRNERIWRRVRDQVKEMVVV